MAAPRAEKQRNQSRPTSLGGGKVRVQHRLHGEKAPPKDDRSIQRQKRSTRSSRKPRVRHEYDTPFDDKGRCHYHKNVQLASKKMTGGWKVLCSACPKCMEQKMTPTTAHGSGDEISVRSIRSVKSSSAASSSGGGKKYDANGCCVVHSHIQVAKKKVLGGGWKVMRVCPSCNGGTTLGLDDDNVSLKSGRSGRSASSRRSTKSSKSRSKSKSRPGKASKSGRYGSLPFDGDGYCCVHPSVQIAQKKMMGGFKIIHDVCPECAAEGTGGGGGGGSRRNRSASRGRLRSLSRHRKEKKDDGGDETSTKKKKRIRVKNLKTEDENGEHGRYSGYVNDDHQPHGEGAMKYEDGNVWEGVWNEGSQVHGKLKKGAPKKKAEKSSKH